MLFSDMFPRFLAADSGGAGGGTVAPGTPAKIEDPTNKPGAAPQPAVVELPDDPGQLKAALAKQRADLEHLLTVHGEMKDKYAKREAAEEKAKAEALKTQGQFQALYEEAAPRVESLTVQAKRQEEALTRYLEAEIATVPDSMKPLIPDGDAVAKLEWISKAKASGALVATGTKPKAPGAPPPGLQGEAKTADDFNRMSAKDRADFMVKGGRVTY